MTDEFNVQLGLDIFSEKDSKGENVDLAQRPVPRDNIPGVRAPRGHSLQPTSQAVLEAFLSHWTSWAGYPERGVMSDRAKYSWQSSRMRSPTMAVPLIRQPKPRPGRLDRSRGTEASGKRAFGGWLGPCRWPEDLKFSWRHQP